MQINSVQPYNTYIPHSKNQKVNLSIRSNSPSFGTLHFDDHLIGTFQANHVNVDELLEIKNNTKDLSERIFNKWLETLISQTSGKAPWYSYSSNSPFNSVVHSTYGSVLKSLPKSEYFRIIGEVGYAHGCGREDKLDEFFSRESIRRVCDKYDKIMYKELRKVFDSHGADFDIDLYVRNTYYENPPASDCTLRTEYNKLYYRISGLGKECLIKIRDDVGHNQPSKYCSMLLDCVKPIHVREISLDDEAYLHDSGSVLVKELLKTYSQIRQSYSKEIEPVIREELKNVLREKQYDKYDLLK